MIFYDQLRLHRPAFLGAVEVDDVHPVCAGVGEGLGGFDGVNVVVQLLRVVTLLEADDFAGAEVDAGDDDQWHIAEATGQANKEKGRYNWGFMDERLSKSIREGQIAAENRRVST